MANKITDLKRVHIVGVCGTLMGAFASYLKRQGIVVTGSDQNVYPPMSDVLRNAGIELYSGYDAANLMRSGQKPDLVVIGNVVRSDNPEAVEVMRGGYRYSSLPQAMEEFLLQDTRNLVVAGTHGKTTSSALMSYVLSSAGADPAYFIGGVVKDLPHSFHVPQLKKQSYFVLEGDEYDTAFWDKVPKFNHYLPDDVILTSVEYDHADIYPNFEAVYRAFEGLLSRIRPQGRLIACMDYPAIRELIQKAQVPVLTYGSQPGPGVRFAPTRIRTEGGMNCFSILDGDRVVDEIVMELPGNHNVLNALAVWIECTQLGLAPEAIRAGLKSFQGVKRRQEVRGEVNQVMVIDDFAHHPTAVRETLKALRGRYPDRRLVAVFEPRSATSRRKIFQAQYAAAFDEADAAFIAVPYDTSRIPEKEQFSTEQLIADIRARTSRCKKADLMKDVESGVSAVAELVRPGDLVAVLSNGGFGGFIPKLLHALNGKG